MSGLRCDVRAKVRSRRWRALAVLCLLICVAMGRAQQPIGSVAPADATVSGDLEISNGRIELVGASTVTARDHTAEVKLARGGAIRVCSTSGLHVATGRGAVEAPLMLALDRGAVEIATRVTASDVLMTPDLRFTMAAPGALDLRLRVARNGDTCVENRGTTAPMLNVADQFGEASYEVKPGQHVLFEHGSLKEVVDHESEPCGCPAAPVISVADAGVSGSSVAAAGSAVAAKTAAEQHPFPAAQSAGLAPLSGPPQAPAGVVHAQVSTTLSYGADGGAASSANDGNGAVSGGGAAGGSSNSRQAETAAAQTAMADGSAKSEVAGKAEAPPPPPAPSPNDLFHSLGRFFRHLFGGH